MLSRMNTASVRLANNVIWIFRDVVPCSARRGNLPDSALQGVTGNRVIGFTCSCLHVNSFNNKNTLLHNIISYY